MNTFLHIQINLINEATNPFKCLEGFFKMETMFALNILNLTNSGRISGYV